VRITHVTDCYLPRLGGIEVQVRELALQQKTAGHDVRVITATPGDDVERGVDLVDGLEVHRVTARMPYDLPLHPRVNFHIAAILRRHPTDVVHAHGGVVSPFAYPAARRAARLGVPTVMTIHSLWASATPAFSLADRVLRWSRWGVTLSAVSEAAAAPIREIVAGRQPVYVTNNGIDVAHWRTSAGTGAARSGAARSGAARSDGAVHIVAVMRLAPRKRSLPLVSMLNEVRRAVPADIALRATLAGDGPAMGKVRGYLEAHDMTEWVTLAGRLDHDEIRALYADADIFVAPAQLESFGLAALEARTAGVPVVAFRATGMAEFVTDGVEGVLVDDDASMVVALAWLASDAAERTKIAEHNRATVPEQDWPRVLERVDEVYAAAIASQRSSTT